ncbi:MAG: flagellar biosynthesis anti-sigma factor FlgM [Phycisphaerales bacterium]|nr:flagellar biosynthesis anti-sigma factor FlgM [Phycisphaerales bacterium]
MTELAPIDRTRAIHPAAAAYARAGKEEAAPTIRRGTDHVEVSELATYLAKIRQLPIRQELVDRVRDEISRGEYDTPDRVEAAVEELLKDL